jgi:hypothetical protein
MPGMVVHAYSPTYLVGENRITVQGWLRQKHKTLSKKKLKQKRAGHGSSDKELSSNTSTTKNFKKECCLQNLKYLHYNIIIYIQHRQQIQYSMQATYNVQITDLSNSVYHD